MASITISDTSPRVQYTASGSQTAFTVPFEFFNATDIKVIKTVGRPYLENVELIDRYEGKNLPNYL